MTAMPQKDSSAPELPREKAPTRRTARRRKTPRPHSRWPGLAAALLCCALLSAAFFLQWRINQRELQREQELLEGIHAAANRHGLDPALVRAVVWKESRFNPQSVGTKGEIGLMQITSGAVQDWARVNRQPIPKQDELFQSDKNLDIGCWYLAHCRKHWNGYASQELLQLAEYNAGRTKVLRDWAPKTPEATITPEDITYPSTRTYVQQILERQRLYHQERAALPNH